MWTGDLKGEVRLVLGCCFVVLSLAMAGCINIVRYEEERVDQDISGGNRGYVLGQVPPAEETTEPKTMTFYKVDINFPPESEDFRSVSGSDKEVSGNRGYIVGGPAQIPQPETEKPARPVKKVKPKPGKVKKPLPGAEELVPHPVEEGPTAQEPGEVSEPEVIKASAVPGTEPKDGQPEVQDMKTVTSYKVQKKDTLERIAAKVYGDKNKWPLIYKANKQTIKQPNKIYPGQVLVIPRD